MNRTAALKLAASLPKGDPIRRDILARISRRGSDKTAALKDGPVGRVLDKYWNTLHDIEQNLRMVIREYDAAASYRGGPAQRDAEKMIKVIEKAADAVDQVATRVFSDLYSTEAKFVQEYGEPSEYVSDRRDRMFS